MSTKKPKSHGDDLVKIAARKFVGPNDRVDLVKKSHAQQFAKNRVLLSDFQQSRKWFNSCGRAIVRISRSLVPAQQAGGFRLISMTGKYGATVWRRNGMAPVC